MSATHTPGPWSVDTDLEFSVDCEDEENGEVASGWVVISSEDHTGFAAVIVDMSRPNSWDGEQMDANARLIAAAPDLLAACQAVAASSMRNETYDLCVAAIARATTTAEGVP